jgi:tetratricopeptide (TPR) repeat protein
MIKKMVYVQRVKKYKRNIVIIFTNTLIILREEAMKRKTTILMIVVMLTLCSCATLSTIFSSAVGEYNEGMGYFNQGKFQEASGHFAKAVELDPEYGEAYLYLGRSYINLGLWGQALSPLRTAYRLTPIETKKEIGAILFDALLSAAVGQIKQGNFKEGISYLKEGMSLDAGSGKAQEAMVSALVGYGGQLLENGNPTDAINAFQEALGYNQGSVDVYTGLVRAFLMNGNWLKAKETASQALRLNPNSSGLNQLFQQLLTAPR